MKKPWILGLPIIFSQNQMSWKHMIESARNIKPSDSQQVMDTNQHLKNTDQRLKLNTMNPSAKSIINMLNHQFHRASVSLAHKCRMARMAPEQQRSPDVSNEFHGIVVWPHDHPPIMTGIPCLIYHGIL